MSIREFESIGFSVQEKKFKIDFFLDVWPFLIRAILALFFALQITKILSIKFPVNWLFGSVEELQNKFSVIDIRIDCGQEQYLTKIQPIDSSIDDI